MFIQDWTALVVNSLQEIWWGVIKALGSILGALIVFLVGLVIAAGLASLVEKLVSLLKLDKVLVGVGLKEYFDRAGLNINTGKFFGKIVYWFIVVVFLLAASDILGFYALSGFLRDVLLYIPSIVVAVLIMLASVVIANFLRHLVRMSVKSAKLHAAYFLASLTWWAVVVFGFLAALSQLGVAVAIINALVTGLVAMIALAGGIAFGLGGKDYAANLVSKVKDHFER